MSEVELKAETKQMLTEIINDSQKLVDELKTLTESDQKIHKRAEEIKIELQGFGSTAQFLLKREAAAHGSNTFTYNKDTGTITVPDVSGDTDDSKKSTESGQPPSA